MLFQFLIFNNIGIQFLNFDIYLLVNFQFFNVSNFNLHYTLSLRMNNTINSKNCKQVIYDTLQVASCKLIYQLNHTYLILISNLFDI